MLRVAYEEGEAEVMAAILSCALSYEFIAKKILAEYPAADKHEFYGEWVSGYASDSYHEDNEVLADLMNRLTRTIPRSGNSISWTSLQHAPATRRHSGIWHGK